MTTAEHVRQLICLIEKVLWEHELHHKARVCEVIELLERLVASNTPWTMLCNAASDETFPVNHLIANGLIREAKAWGMPLTVFLPLLAELVSGEYWCRQAGGLMLGKISEIPPRCLKRRIGCDLDIADEDRTPFASRVDRYAVSQNPRLLTVSAIALRRLEGESLDSILDGREQPKVMDVQEYGASLVGAT